MACDDCQRITSPESGLFFAADKPGEDQPFHPTNIGISRIIDRLAKTSLSHPTEPQNVWDARRHNGVHEGEDPAVGPVSMLLKASYYVLKLSAIRGCHCCQFFAKYIDRRAGAMDVKTGEPIYLTRVREARKIYESLADGDRIELYQTDISKPIETFTICTRELESTYDHGITRRVVAPNSMDPECTQYVRDRLEHCEKYHPKCAAIGSFVPTRLLEVDIPDRPDIIRLVITNDLLNRDFHYTALSHCWGLPDREPLTTTTKSIAERTDHIVFDNLPRSFKDAVMLTRELGLRYLWIDSLCIIQDSEPDWTTESSRMADIYKRSTLTIAASCSHNSYDGFRSIRTSPFYFDRSSFGLHDHCELPSPSSWDKSHTVVLEPYHGMPFVGELIHEHFNSPLNKRAWALQERILSYRTVFYDRGQVLWECNTARYLEGWTMDLKSLFWRNSTHFAAVMKPYSTNDSTSGSQADDYEIYEQWYTMLEEFRARALTYPTDALPALSGIARDFNSRTGDKYLAGIWQNDLFRGLTWSLDLGSGYVRVKTQQQPSEKCFAPSWSWASLQEGRILSTSVQKGSMLRMPEALQPKLIRTDIIPVLSDKMSHIKSGQLTIDGSYRMVSVLHEERYGGSRNPYGQYQGLRDPLVFEMDCLEPKHLNQHLRPFVDHTLWFEQHTGKALRSTPLRLVCLALCMSKSEGWDNLHCLLLYGTEEQENKQQYQRCGVLNVRIYNSKMLIDGWKRKPFMLI